MELKDIEQLLKNAKFKHLSEEALASYRDSELDELGLALADAHLELCVICERRLDFLREEAEALENYEITEKDRALIRETIRQLEPEPTPQDNIQTRLASYFDALVAAWVLPFSRVAVRGTKDGDVIWKYESQDGLLTAWARLEKNANLTVHFSSSELAWEGARLRFRLGRFSTEVTLQRKGGTVSAKIVIPRAERPKKMNDISIEILEAD